MPADSEALRHRKLSTLLELPSLATKRVAPFASSSTARAFPVHFSVYNCLKLFESLLGMLLEVGSNAQCAPSEMPSYVCFGAPFVAVFAHFASHFCG